MPLNLGSVYFGVDAATQGLQDGLRDIVHFGATVDAAARKTSQGAVKTATALRNQERAAVAAWQKTLDFNIAVAKAGGDVRLIQIAEKAFRDFTFQMTSGERSAVDFSRANLGLEATLKALKRELDAVKQSASGAGGSFIDAFKAERAMTTAQGHLAKFQQMARASGDDGADLARDASTAFQNLSRILQQGKVSTNDYNRATLEFAASMGRLRRELVEIRSDAAAANQALANAFTRQKNIAQATEAVANFQQQLHKIRVDRGLIASSTSALDELKASLGRAGATSLDVQQAMLKFNTSMSQMRREFRALKDDIKPPEESLLTLKNVMNTLSNASVLAVGPLSGLGARMTALNAITSRTGAVIAGLVAGITGATLVMGKLVQASIRTAYVMDQIEARFDATTDSQQEMTEKMDDLREIADRTGLVFSDLSRQYGSFAAAAAGTSLEGDQTTKMFEDLAYAVSAFRLDAISTEGVFRALEQMMSKGNVQAEELRNQLGDRLPGAFQAAARSMNVTTQELNDMLKAGQVQAEDFLPAFVQELRSSLGGDVTGDIDSLRASTNRLTNATFEFVRAFDEAFGISRIFKFGVEAVTSVIEFLTRNMNTLRNVAAGTLAAIVALSGPMVIRGFRTMVTSISAATAAMTALNVATAANPIGGLMMTLLKAGAIIGAVAVGLGAFGSANAQDRGYVEYVDDLTQAMDDYIRAQNELVTTEVYQTGLLRTEASNRLALIPGEIEAARAEVERLTEAMSAPGVGDFAGSISGAMAEQEAKIASLVAEYEALERRLIELGAIQGEQAAKQRAEEEARAAAAERAYQALRRQTIDTNNLAEATRQGSGAVEALQRILARHESLAQFAKDLEDAKVTTEEATRLTQEYAMSLANLDEALKLEGMRQFEQNLDRIRQRTAALIQGDEAVAELEIELNIEDQVEAERDRLMALGTDADIVEARLHELEQALRDVAAAEKAAGDAKKQKEIADAHAETVESLRDQQREMRLVAQYGEDSQRVAEERLRQEQEARREQLLVKELSDEQYTITLSILMTMEEMERVNLAKAWDDAAIAAAKLRAEIDAMDYTNTRRVRNAQAAGGAAALDWATMADDLAASAAFVIQAEGHGGIGPWLEPHMDSKTSGGNDQLRIGYSSDTMTLATGEVIQGISSSDRVSEEDAMRDLRRRVQEAHAHIAEEVGLSAWNMFDSAQKAVLTSLVYNYGSIDAAALDGLVPILQSGDIEAIARHIESQTENAERRQAEADVFRQGGGWEPAAPGLPGNQGIAGVGTDIAEAEARTAEEAAREAEKRAEELARLDEQARDAATRAMERQIEAYNDLKGSIDPVVAAQQALQEGLKVARAEFDAGRIDMQEFQVVADQLNATYQKTLGEMDTATQRHKDAISGFFDDVTQAITNAIIEGENFRESFANILKAIAADLLNSGIRRIAAAVFGGIFPGAGESDLIIPAAGSGMPSGAGSLVGAAVSGGVNALLGGGASPLDGLEIYSGGGYTGDAPRSGGIDGEGGRLAIIHPQEQIIDYAKGGGGGGAPQVVREVYEINITGTTDKELRELLNTSLRTAFAKHDRALPDRVNYIAKHKRDRG